MLGPPVDLLHSWRVVKSPDTGLNQVYLFGGEQIADSFIDKLPQSMSDAEQNWAGFFGAHGTVPPYGIAGGPFNSACFTDAPGGIDTSRDCSKDPQTQKV